MQVRIEHVHDAFAAPTGMYELRGRPSCMLGNAGRSNFRGCESLA